MTDEVTPQSAQEVPPPPEDPVVKREPAKSIRAAQRSFKLTLPCGVVHDEKVLRTITLQTVTAGDRHVFGDRKLLRNPGELISQLIEAKLVGIDGLRGVSRRHIDNMLAFDRDFIVFHLRQETTNNRPFMTPVKCSSCGALNEVMVAPEEIEETLKIMPDDVRLKQKGGRTVYEVTLEDYGFHGTFMYPDGTLQAFLGPKLAEQDANPFDLELETFRAVCVDFNGEGRLQDAGDLSIEFVEAVQAEMRKLHYGYDMRTQVKCYSCGHEMRVMVDPLDFLYGSLKARI